MASAKKSSNPSKSCWCLGALGTAYNEKGLCIQNVRPCRYGADQCYNAHSQGEIKEESFIKAWANCNKTNFNLHDIDKNIRSVIGAERDSIKDGRLSSAAREMEKLRLDTLLFLWWDLACYHRKIAKDLRRTSYSEGYSDARAVPKFYLVNEDNIWALVRTLRICEKQKYLVENPMIPIDIKDICVGDVNCKHGVHKNCLLACIDDMLYGTCECKTLEEVEAQKSENEAEILRLRQEFKTCKTDEKLKIVKQICVIQDQNKTLFRKVHYTEQGMVPLSVHKEAETAKAPKKITAETVSGKAVRKIGKKKK